MTVPAPGPAAELAGEPDTGAAPLLSVCILARDEEENLPRCIAAARVLADEIVVYDTGSVDATAAVARELGAVVVEARWPGDFATARNAALAHCRGAWVLSLDADEELRCPDPERARRSLRDVSPEHRALQVSIDNATGVGLGAGYANVADKLFRPDRCRWRGRLHEQLVDAASGELVSSAYVSWLRIAHHGYLADTLTARHKAERNLALARAEVADPSFGDQGIALVLLGRALWAAGQAEQALDPLLEGASATRNATARRQALTAATRISLRLGRVDDAREIVGHLRLSCDRTVLPDVLAAGVHLAAHEPASALALLARVTAVTRDDDGYEHGPATVAPWTAEALVALGRPGEAADLLLGLLRLDHALDAELDLVVEALERAGRDLCELADAVPAELVAPITAAALRLEPDRGELVLRALWRHERGGPRSVAVLAGAALLARLLPAPQAVEWSQLLRAHGLGELCPLVALADDETAPRPRRLAAARAASELGETSMRDACVRLSSDSTPHVTPAPVGKSPPHVSIVIDARRGAAALLACLEALATTLAEAEQSQHDSPCEVEVVAIDPGSRDGSAHVLDSIVGDVAVVRFADDPGTARARNAGAVVSRGEILVFLDAAATPQPGWLQPLLARLRDHPRRGAVSACLAGPDHSPLRTSATVRISSGDARPAHGLARRSWTALRASRVALDWSAPVDLRPGPAVPTAHALAVRRGAFLDVGGFDEGYCDLAEDLDLVMALRARGHEVGFEEGSLVVLDRAIDPTAIPFGIAGEPDRPFAELVGWRWSARDNHDRFAARWAATLRTDAPQAVRSR
ncbi:MAG: glycosyltransferase [Acidimicrobiales bacterium]